VPFHELEQVFDLLDAQVIELYLEAFGVDLGEESLRL